MQKHKYNYKCTLKDANSVRTNEKCFRALPVVVSTIEMMSFKNFKINVLL